jgi:hypothetical protein
MLLVWYILIFIGLGLFYVVVTMMVIPGLKEERFGTRDPLPADLGEWKPDYDSKEARAALADGLQREQRLWLEENRSFFGRRLLRQVRYRNVNTGEIERVEPDRRVRRSELANMK